MSNQNKPVSDRKIQEENGHSKPSISLYILILSQLISALLLLFGSLLMAGTAELLYQYQGVSGTGVELLAYAAAGLFCGIWLIRRISEEVKGEDGNGY